MCVFEFQVEAVLGPKTEADLKPKGKVSAKLPWYFGTFILRSLAPITPGNWSLGKHDFNLYFPIILSRSLFTNSGQT